MNDRSKVAEDHLQRRNVISDGGKIEFDFDRHSSSPVLCDNFTVERPGERATPSTRSPWMRSDNRTGLSPEPQGAADQALSLGFGRSDQRLGFCITGEPHPVDAAFGRLRLGHRHARLKVDPDHHAAGRGSSRFHAATISHGGASVFPNNRQPNGVNK